MHHRLDGSDDTLDELYLKPDDQQEVNDVADRCRPIVEELNNLLDQYLLAAANDHPLDSVPILTSVLREGLE